MQAILRIDRKSLRLRLHRHLIGRTGHHQAQHMFDIPTRLHELYCQPIEQSLIAHCFAEQTKIVRTCY